jgi:predicted nucleic acid-binding protein
VAVDRRERRARVLGRPSALADTGALLACLDRTDAWHDRCRSALDTLRFPLATSLAVLAELFHMVGPGPREVETAWGLVRSGAITVLPISDPELADLEALMRQYHDRPMDLADATLVHLARRESVSTVFTVDHDDFETYRIGGRKRFSILPER